MDLETVKDKQKLYIARLAKAMRLGAQEFEEFKEYKRIIRNLKWENLPTGKDRRILEQASGIQRACKIKNLNIVKDFCQKNVDYYLYAEELLQNNFELKHNVQLKAKEDDIQTFFRLHATTINMYKLY